MQKSNPINSVYLIALAVAGLVSCISSFYTALIFAIVVVAAFLVSMSIVSMVEKIADKHVKFLVFALISAALITILKVLGRYINIDEVVYASDIIEMAIVPCLLMAIVPIYLDESLSVKHYFGNSLLMSLAFFLMTLMFGSVVEVLGHGAFAGKALDFEALSFFAMPYGGFIIIATLCVLFNMIRRAYLKKTRRFNMLVDKYKLQILEVKSSAQRDAKLNKKGGDK